VQRVIVAPDQIQLDTHTHSVGLLWMRDRPVAEPVPANTQYSCPPRDDLLWTSKRIY